MRSMSRASFAVLMVRMTGPPFRAQVSAIRRAVATFAVIVPSGAGQGRSFVMDRSSCVSPQLTGADRPTPRGSKPITS